MLRKKNKIECEFIERQEQRKKNKIDCESKQEDRYSLESH